LNGRHTAGNGAGPEEEAQRVTQVTAMDEREGYTCAPGRGTMQKG
jgi:hypothetical protein